MDDEPARAAVRPVSVGARPGGCGRGRHPAGARCRMRQWHVRASARGSGPRRCGVALDLSEGMLPRVAPRRECKQTCRVCRTRPEIFDLALAPHMLYHVPDVRAAAAELRRVLDAAGVFVAVTNSVANLGELVALVEAAVGTGWKMERPADLFFSLENGGELLAAGFDDVRRVDCPPSAVVVTDVEAIAEYVASTADHYEEGAEVPWSGVVDRVREMAGTIIARDGELRLTSAIGAFVCR